MQMKNDKPVHGIARRLFFAVLFFSLVITIISTVIETGMLFRTRVNEAHARALEVAHEEVNELLPLVRRSDEVAIKNSWTTS